MPYSYAREKFFIAVMSLVSDLPIRERLESAALSVHTINAIDLPPDERERFTALWSRLTRDEAEFESEGTIKASIRNLSNDEAGKAAEDFVSILTAVYDE